MTGVYKSHSLIEPTALHSHQHLPTMNAQSYEIYPLETYVSGANRQMNSFRDIPWVHGGCFVMVLDPSDSRPGHLLIDYREIDMM